MHRLALFCKPKPTGVSTTAAQHRLRLSVADALSSMEELLTCRSLAGARVARMARPPRVRRVRTRNDTVQTIIDIDDEPRSEQHTRRAQVTHSPL
jgi:hypothetical protein